MTTAIQSGRGSSAASTTTARATLAAAVLGTALAYMSDDMLNLAIPAVARDLGATVTDVQWILNVYYVSLVSSVLVAGSIGDIVGHRRLFLAGLVVFSAGAIACATAPGIPVLVAARLFQGVGAALLLTAGLALVSRSSGPADRSRVVGTFLGLVAAVPAVGPFLSGMLVDAFSWRALFLIPLVLPLVAIGLTLTFVAETPAAEGRHPDVAGAAIAFATLASLSVGLIVGASDWTSPLPVAALAASAIGAVAFLVVERRANDPMLPLHLFRRRVFLGGNLVWLLGCLTSWGAVFFLAVSLQVTLGLRPLVAGLVLTPIYLVMMVGAPLAGRLADRIGPRPPVLAGLLLYASGLVLLGRIGSASDVIPEVVVPILVLAAGMALFTAPLAAATLGALDDADQGVASGVNNAVGQLAGLLGVVLLPAAAGLAGVSFGDPEFAAGYPRAMWTMAVIAAACLPLAAWTLRRMPELRPPAP